MGNCQGSISSAVKHLLARPVAFHPVLARMCGSVTAGLMLSQAIYWSDRTRDGSGWFYKTGREWTEEICLSRSEQETARGILRGMGFMREELRGMPATVHFLVDMDRLCEAFEQYAGKPQSSLRKTSKPVCEFPAKRESDAPVGGKPANQSAGKSQSPLLRTEITAEITQKPSSSPSGLDLQEAAACLLRYDAAMDQEAIDKIVAGVLAERPDVTLEEFDHFVGLKARVAGKSVAGLLITALPKCFEGYAFERTRERLQKAAARRQAQRVEEASRESDRACLCYVSKRTHELVVCVYCQSKAAAAAREGEPCPVRA